MPNSRWADIFTHLSDKGFNVYSPGQHKGECLKPYVVVKNAGGNQFGGFSSTQQLYELLLYVPHDHYSSLEPFVGEVKGAMKELEPMIKPTHYETPSFLDDTVKGHMVSIQYVNYKKL